MKVTGSTQTNYNFAVLGGGGIFRCTRVTFANISFNNGGLIQVTSNVTVILTSCTATNISRATGNGVLLSSSSTLEVNVQSFSIVNLSAPQATTGGLIYLANVVSSTPPSIILSNLQSMFRLCELCVLRVELFRDMIDLMSDLLLLCIYFQLIALG
jgi:hypothetical protein